ncbi:MAG: RIP metalloprotease RseP [Verrucomicrobiaceae bacterium]
MEFLSSAFHFIGILILVLLVFNLMILVHEWGHFVAARWCGLKIEKFQIWFGKPLWKKTINGVQYGLGCIPAGGFVALPQMAPMNAIEGGAESAEPLPPITPMDKIIVAFAGPLFSFALACFFALIVSFVGYPDRHSKSTLIGWVDKTMPAFEAGLRPGDRILEIDGTPIHLWDGPIDSVLERIAFSNNEKIEFLVERPGEKQPLKFQSGIKIEKGTFFQRRGLRRVGIANGGQVRVSEVVSKSPADLAGLKAEDVIASFNGKPVYHSITISEYLKEHSGEAVTLGIKHGDKTDEILLTPIKPIKPSDHSPSLGLALDTHGDDISDKLVFTPAKRLIGDALTIMFRTVKGLVTPGSDISVQHLSGPLKIGSIYFRLFEIPEGWRLVLWFSVILNVNLAVMNMLPFPVLDGGHITMAILSMIRRKPLLSIKALEIFQTSCALLLFGFMIYVTWYDSLDFFGGDTKDVPIKKLEFAAPAK